MLDMYRPVAPLTTTGLVALVLGHENGPTCTEHQTCAPARITLHAPIYERIARVPKPQVVLPWWVGARGARATQNAEQKNS